MPELKIRHYHTVIMVPLTGGRARYVPVLLDPAGTQIVSVTQWVLNCRLKTSTLLQAVRHIGYLYDYSHASQRTEQSKSSKSHMLVHNCLEALRLGTIDDYGACALGLFWSPKGQQHKRIRRDIARYANHLLEVGQAITDGPVAVASRSWLKNHGGLLSYLTTHKSHDIADRDDDKHRLKAVRASHKTQSYGDYGGAVTAFPKESIESFVIEGSRRSRQLSDRTLSAYSREFNVRDQLAKLLIFGGGLRSEELFHIFGVDVKRSDGLTDVSLFHPSEGVIFRQGAGRPSPTPISRAEYLWSEFRLHPRNVINPKSPMYAGWKNLLLLETKRLKYTKVFWIDKCWGELFWAIHRIYVRDYLSRMKLNHPYYFTCINAADFGRPWTQAAFKHAWKFGLERIGLKQGRHSGTSPHGGRHAYGIAAANIGIDPRIRQIMMHHRNIFSQLRYQRPNGAQVDHEISQAQQRIIASLDSNADGFSSSRGVHLMRSVLDTAQAESRSGPSRSRSDVFSAWFNDPTDLTGVFSSWDFYQNLRGRHGF